jgi:glycosyltransferase involved in cell wall biosynthesis
VSTDIRDALTRAGARPERIDVVLNGIDAAGWRRDRSREPAARAALGVTGDDVVVGAVGRLEPQKRFDRLIEAVAGVRLDLPHVRLLIAGEGSERPALESLISRLGLGTACRLLGRRDDIASFHHGLDLFVQASDYEGTSNAVLEAMALETPVVATAAGGTRELLRDGDDGVLVPEPTVASLALAIRRTLSDPAGARARSAQARRRVETTLSFDARTAVVERVYEQLAAATRRRAADRRSTGA